MIWLVAILSPFACIGAWVIVGLLWQRALARRD